MMGCSLFRTHLAGVLCLLGCLFCDAATAESSLSRHDDLARVMEVRGMWRSGRRAQAMQNLATADISSTAGKAESCLFLGEVSAFIHEKRLEATCSRLALKLALDAVTERVQENLLAAGGGGVVGDISPEETFPKVEMLRLYRAAGNCVNDMSIELDYSGLLKLVHAAWSGSPSEAAVKADDK